MKVCPYCHNASELNDLLGHDRMGHWVANGLRRSGIFTVEQLRATHPATLRDIRMIGTHGIQLIQDRLKNGPRKKGRNADQIITQIREFADELASWLHPEGVDAQEVAGRLHQIADGTFEGGPR